jgi:tetratricopeptide (TPR) repeat protein
VPDLWRAHYYLGRVHRDRGDARRAARELTAAIRLQPAHRLPYIALCELYRRRDYVDQALAVAMLGTARVAPAEAAELWLEAGMAHGSRRADGPAIAAFGRALAIHPDDALAKLQRGQLYLRRGELASAERDLEDVLRSPDPRVAGDQPLVTALLRQIHDAGALRDARWSCTHRDGGLVCQPRMR